MHPDHLTPNDTRLFPHWGNILMSGKISHDLEGILKFWGGKVSFANYFICGRDEVEKKTQIYEKTATGENGSRKRATTCRDNKTRQAQTQNRYLSTKDIRYRITQDEYLPPHTTTMPVLSGDTYAASNRPIDQSQKSLQLLHTPRKESEPGPHLHRNASRRGSNSRHSRS